LSRFCKKKCFAQPFSSSLVWLCKFLRKNIGAKAACKMLIKLTTGRWYEEEAKQRSKPADGSPATKSFVQKEASVVTADEPKQKKISRGDLMKRYKSIDVHDVLERHSKERQNISSRSNTSSMPSFFRPVTTSSVKPTKKIMAKSFQPYYCFLKLFLRYLVTVLDVK